MKKSVTMLLVAAMSTAMRVAAVEEEVGGYTWTYRIVGGTAEIYNEDEDGDFLTAVSPEPEGILTIPATLGGKTVTSIGDGAFLDCIDLTGVVIPNGATKIGESAFDGCSSLESVTIPASVTSIGDYAFNCCDSLLDIKIPNGVARLGECLFQDCGSLTNVSIPSSVTSIDTRAFANCSGLTRVDIPAGVTSIGSEAFSWCEGLKVVEIPNGVSRIEDETFYNCVGLVSVTIPVGVTSIGEYAFADCSELRSVTIPVGVTSIGDAAFDGCDLRIALVPESLNGVIDEEDVFGDAGCVYYYTGSIPQIEYTYGYIDNGDGTVTLSPVYDDDGSLLEPAISPMPFGEFTVPGEIDGKRVVEIADNVFDDSCATSIFVPRSVLNISCYAFPCAWDLTNITVAADNPAYKSVDGILYTKNGKELVACPHAKGGNIAVAPGTERIGGVAFYCNDNLLSVAFPEGLKTIGYNAFGGCENENFTSIVIPANMVAIDAQAFANCSCLETVAFAGTEEDIDIDATAFAGTPYEAAKPFSLVIKKRTLAGIHGIAPENLVISDHLNGQVLTAIGSEALSGWNFRTASVTNIVVPEGVTSIGEHAFGNDAALQSVSLPVSLNNIAWGAFGYCSSLREIRIPAGVQSISENPFYGCANLTVYAPDTLRGRFSVPDGCTIMYYEIPEYTITLYANGGAFGGAATETTTAKDGTETVAFPMPVSDGQLFAGWFTAAVGGTRVTVVTGDMTLYAHWVESPFSGMSEEYPWMLDGDGNWRNGAMPSGTNSWAEITVEGPCLVTFQWMRINGFLSVYVDGAQVAGGGEFDEWTEFSRSFRDEGTHTIRFELESLLYQGRPESSLYCLVRNWSVVPIEERRVTFDANGGTFGGETTRTVSAWDGTAVTPPSVPVFAGHLLEGWFTAAVGGTRVTVVSGDTTLYAHWVESPFSGMSANKPWTVENDDSWRSGAISDNQSTWVEIDVTNAPCLVSFSWKTSSESGYDLLHCYLDGNEMLSPISGIMENWATVSIAVAESGTHTIRFEYAKDSSVSNGEDCGWVRNFVTAPVVTRILLMDVNDGVTAATEKHVVNGYAIGFLPETVWNGTGHFRFCGWFTAAEDGEEVTCDSVVLQGWTRLYAHWQEIDPPANDNFAAATTISGASGSIDGTTVDSSRELVDLIPDVGDKEYRSTVWYRWTAPADGRYRFLVADAGGCLDLYYYIGITAGYDTEDESWSEASLRRGDVWADLSINATSNKVYWIEVASWRDWEGNEEFDFTLSWDVSPANDEYEDAQVLASTESGSVPGTLAGATITDNDCIWQYGDAGRTVWYKWVAPFTGNVRFLATADNDEDDLLYLVATYGYDEENEEWDDCGYDDGNSVSFDVEEGTTYYVSLATWNDVVGGFTLSWQRLQAPGNDNFANATVISGVSGHVTGTNLGASTEEDEPLPFEVQNNNTFASTATVWWKWTAPTNASFVFQTQGSDFDTVLGIYTGNVVNALGTVAVNDDGGEDDDRTSAVTFNAVEGTTYYIAVGGYGDEAGDVVLEWGLDSGTDDVVVNVGGGKTVTVPALWLLENTDRAATDDAANGRKVWECYLLGLAPEDPDDDFQITRFWMDGDIPMFEFSHTVDGSGVSFIPRIRKLGKANLSDEWQEVPEDGDSTFRFFKVEVELP